MTGPRTIVAALLCSAAAWSTAAMAEPSATLRDLVAKFRCPLADRLEQVYTAGRATRQRDRFIVVTVPEHPHGYVQCMFVKRKTTLLCEAASGYFVSTRDAPRLFRLPDEAVAALGQLGFDTADRKGNFRIMVKLPKPPDFDGIAEFILQALHDGYDARAQSNLRVNAPFAPRPTPKCAVVN